MKTGWGLREYLLIITIALTLGLGGLGCGWWQEWRLAKERGIDPATLMSQQDGARSVVAVVALVVAFAWMVLLVTDIRAQLAIWLGDRLGVTIKLGHKLRWDVVEPGRIGAKIIVFLVDIVFVLSAVYIPFCLALVGVILLTQS